MDGKFVMLMHHQLVRWTEGVQIPPVRKREKDSRNRLHVDSNNNRSWPQQAISLWEVIIIFIMDGKLTFPVPAIFI